MQLPIKIENCPVCGKLFEPYGIGMACLECSIFIDVDTGEIGGFIKQHGIIKNVMGKLKNFLESLNRTEP